MATNGAQQAFGLANVLQAMLTMRGGDSDKKERATKYLGEFQKSVRTRWRERGRATNLLKSADLCRTRQPHGPRPSTS